MLIPLLYALCGRLPSFDWAGLQLFTLAVQTKKPKLNMAYEDNSRSCFDNLQHYNLVI